MTVSAAVPVGIVADDLTGATDSAVQFAADGWTARLSLATDESVDLAPGSVTSTVTDARALHPDAACASTVRAVQSMHAAGAERIFIKIDSTMRGSVEHQIRGALEAWREVHPDAFAVVCPAYPAMGRTVVGGHLLVDGVGVHKTPVGIDPVTPVATSDIVALLPGSVIVRLQGKSAAEDARSLIAAAATGAVVVVDAASADDLRKLATAVAALGPKAVPVGAAGLAAALSHEWGIAVPAVPAVPVRASRVLVVLSSLHAVSREQVEHLKGARPAGSILNLAPNLQQILDLATIASWTERQLDAEPDVGDLIVVQSPIERSAGTEAGDAATEVIAESLATMTATLCSRVHCDALVLLGGEGARATLLQLGTTSIRIHVAIREGIPMGSLEGGFAHGATVVTKAGGFGSESAVTDIVAELLRR